MKYTLLMLLAATSANGHVDGFALSLDGAPAEYVSYTEADIDHMSVECARALLRMNFCRWDGGAKPEGWDDKFKAAWTACPELRTNDLGRMR